MSPPATTRHLDTAVWAFVYGGLLTVCLGVALQRGGEAWGWGLVAIGSLLAVAGAVLIVVRSRLPGGSNHEAEETP